MFLNYRSDLADPLAVLVGLAVVVVLAEASYQLVEEVARKRLRNLKLRWETGVIFASIAVLGIATTAVRYQQVEGRLPDEVETIAAEVHNRSPGLKKCHINRGIKSPGCVAGGNRISAILVGDSHAAATKTAVALNGEDSSAS
ncbi:hypothetical protein [Microbulbifer agarilyticus]|uniref:hypothetical protein n=1 Tax=Microbulbifer agarilyticus TaxID=260552 RepID=UPI001CD5AB98|nr:hypothetical protein [Microbulbifer agarilyticus]MCA0901520.1 hypothetical protein [Microbulbifer agarilyticus]